MDLVRIDPDNWTVFFMKRSDFEYILPAMVDIIIELIPVFINRYLP